MMGWWYGYGPGFGILGGVMMVLWWALIVVLVVALIRWLRTGTWERPEGNSRRRGSALDILKERYAKGEIDDKEFERRKKTLEE